MVSMEERELDRQGFVVQNLPGLMKAPAMGYYRKRNGAIAHLMATPEKVGWYTQVMGFEFLGYEGQFEPRKPDAKPSSNQGVASEFKCECGFRAKSAFGLMAHRRKHERESRKEK